MAIKKNASRAKAYALARSADCELPRGVEPTPYAATWSDDELTPVRTEPKVGRNQPCPCESGKKYKKCCGG